MLNIDVWLNGIKQTLKIDPKVDNIVGQTNQDTRPKKGKTNMFGSINNTTGYHITLHYSSKDVHQNSFHLLICSQNFEGLDNLLQSTRKKFNFLWILKFSKFTTSLSQKIDFDIIILLFNYYKK